MPLHSEQRILPYTPDQLFDLVIGVERYPEFLPWCVAARIRRREPGLLIADLVIGFKLIRESFTSRVEYDARTHTIVTHYTDGPFHHMESRWAFHPHPEGCLVDFHVDFAFRSRLLQSLANSFFTEVVKRMIQAFEKRARKLYGPGPERPSEAAPAG